MDEIEEQSTAWLMVKFKGRDGLAAIPSAVEYRIDDVATGLEVHALTTVTPASEIEIVLTPLDNTILNERGDSEQRRVTVWAHYGLGDQKVTEHIYEVTNLAEVNNGA